VTSSTALTVVVAVVVVAGMLATIVSMALVGGWLDRRATTERQQALDDLERYGPLAPGLAPPGRGREGPPPCRRRTHLRSGTRLPPPEGRRQRTQGPRRGHRQQSDDLPGIGPQGAARLLVEVGDVTRFPTAAHFASWTGTAPIDASSGDQVRHRLSRGGNRQINRVLHIMAIVQLRNPSEGRSYFDRKKNDGKTSMEAIRCVKRRLSDIVYRTMLDDAVRTGVTGPGRGHQGTTTNSSATGSHPTTGSSDKPLPGPVPTETTPPLKTAS